MIVIWEKSIPYLKYVRPEITAINISTPWTISWCGQKMEVIQQFSSPSSTVTIILKEKKSLTVGNVMGQYSFPTGEGNQLLKTAMQFIMVKASSGCRWKWQTRIKKAQDIIIPPFLQVKASHQLLGCLTISSLVLHVLLFMYPSICTYISSQIPSLFIFGIFVISESDQPIRNTWPFSENWLH